MRCRSIVYLIATTVVTACNRDVSAPKALEIADAVERQLSQKWNATVMGHLAYVDNAFTPFRNDPDSTIIGLTTDGVSDYLTAAVLERVYVPPRGVGAPVSRRSLFAWRHDANYAIYAVTETNADDSGTIGDYRFENDVLNPRPQLLAPHEREDDWWLGQAGKVVIEPEKTGERCPFQNGGEDADEDKSGRVTCDVVTYKVTIDGELLRRLDFKNALLPDALKPRHHITVTTQRVNGIRFTIHCHPTELIADTHVPIYWGCNGFPLMFWRSNDLFAPSLGVDIKQMKRFGNRLVYGRTMTQGSEKSSGGPRVLRYTESYPDGTVIERDSADLTHNLPSDQDWLEQCARGMGYGGRRQCLVAPFGHPKMQSRYHIFVVDMEELAR